MLEIIAGGSSDGGAYKLLSALWRGILRFCTSLASKLSFFFYIHPSDRTLSFAHLRIQAETTKALEYIIYI